MKVAKLILGLVLIASVSNLYGAEHGNYLPASDVSISSDQCAGTITFIFLYLNTSGTDEKLKDFDLKIDGTLVLEGKDNSMSGVSESNCSGVGKWYDHSNGSDWCLTSYSSNISFHEESFDNNDFKIKVTYKVPASKIGSEVEFKLEGKWKEGSTVNQDFTGSNSIIRTETVDNPMSPNGLMATNNNCNEIVLDWNNPNITCERKVVSYDFANIHNLAQGCEGELQFIPGLFVCPVYGTCCYTIEIKRGATGSWTDIGQVETYTDTNVEDGVEYEYFIRTVFTSVHGIISYSDQISIRGSSAEILPPPSGLDISANCDNEVNITWEWYSSNPLGFEISRSESINGPFDQGIHLVSGSSRQYTDNDVVKGVKYYYQIRTKNQCNEFGSNSDRINVTVPIEPNPPSDIVTSGLINGILISWQDNSSDETGFIIRRTSTEGFERIFEVDENIVSFKDSTVQNCIRYSYEVLAKNDCVEDGVSGGSVEATFVPDLADLVSNTTLKASKGYFSNRVELSWNNRNKKASIIDFYEIYRKRTNSEDQPVYIGQLEGNSGLYSDVNAEAGVIYEYQIVGIVDCAGDEHATDTLHAYGFRTPTGDIYGRVTFENGQAEENVEVRAESDDGNFGRSLVLNGSQYANINDTSFLQGNSDSVSIQAWISPDDVNGDQQIFSKPGFYSLGILDDHIYFSAGNQSFASASTFSSQSVGASYVHVSGIYSGDSLFIYVNGERTDSTSYSGSFPSDSTVAVLGQGYSGAIDEVRVWSRALGKKEIKRDYNRYLTGGENGLIAYWSFNYATNNEFYDRSYKNSTYNEHHGQLNGISISDSRIPTNEQLGYKGVTGQDGSYSIRAIPYTGNGTVYSIIPRKGIHQFEAQEEIRFIGDGSETFTVNFVDKSSFRVTGIITYEGGTVPVEGVSFYIDGVQALGGNGTILMSDSKGEFEISVPVGSHEVKVQKTNHIFANDGKITDSYGVDLNYQDEVLGLKLQDQTKVKYIGRVAGGAKQDAYMLGHSLSKNNLADGVTVTLTTKNPAYYISSEDTTMHYDHFLPSTKSGNGWPKTNRVDYSKQSITIYPNAETGEFVAYVIPESFTISVNVPGHDDVPGNGEDLNLTQKLAPESIVREYVDSVLVDGNWEKTNYSDTVFYNAAQKFIKRYQPTVRITQLNDAGDQTMYFGDTLYSATQLDGTVNEVKLWESGIYKLGLPVFTQNDMYNFKAEVFEKYTYKDSLGNVKSGVAVDEVPTQDARIEFTNNLSLKGVEEVEADSVGKAMYSFQVSEPELTSGIRSVSAKIFYGDTENATSINWGGAFNAIIIGAVQTGRDFVTGGPDKVLMVLRDPPGSNSYSYLEQGTTITESSTYSGNVKNSGSLLFTQQLGFKVVTWVGVGAGVVNTVENENSFTLGVVHEETIGGSDSKTSVTTTTTKFQTSDDPLYVGADGDVFVGYSTNIAYGATKNVTIIPKSLYDEDPSKFSLYSSITPATNDWLLVQQTGLGVAQTFGTMFAYPQRHLEERLLPELKALRNNFLMQLPSNMTMAELQDLADVNDTTFYVSHLPASDPNFGKNNDDDAFDGVPDPDPFNPYDGPSYKVVFPGRLGYARNDTILYLNQSIDNWYRQLELNEQAKINAVLKQNYSFQGGSPIEYSESLSSTESSTVSFDLMIGANFQNEVGVNILGTGFKLAIDETLSTTHGGTFVDEETESKTKGFVLAESGRDYLSVDVMYDRFNIIGENPTFIFRTQAGATSCPYEGEYTSQYYQPGQHVIDQATKQIEVPEIAVEKDFVENVPTGESAFFTIYIRNNSEIDISNMLALRIVEESNPNGAVLVMDGAPIGNGREFAVSAGETLVKTLEVRKGSVLNYDNLKLVLESLCQYTINDTLVFSVHFTPSCSNVGVVKPSDKWTYNTKLPVLNINGVDKHYIDLRISDFDINYDSFNRIKLQYKSAAESDDGWKTLMNYYADSVTYKQALDDGWNARMINPADAGTIKYQLQMDDLPDQKYDLRAVTVCVINNEEIDNISETASGIKDMYEPRLFGSPQPADGILTIEDEIRLNFNEQIAEGLLTKNNFQVTGIRNGVQTDHSVSVRMDGINDYMYTEFEKNMAGKDITFEMWIKADEPQNATLIHHGDINESIGMALTADNHLQIIVGDNVVNSNSTVPFEAGSWAHVAMVYSKDGYVSAYYNFSEVISNVNVGVYNGIGNFVLGKDISNNANYFSGLMHGVRVWDKTLSSGELQVNSLAKLSGNEPGLYAYYPMTAARGELAEDKARGANMLMEGCEWVVPAGRAIAFNGTNSYLKMNTGSAAIKSSMDYTIEFWFKGAPGQTNATLLSNGRGDGQDLGGSEYLFAVEIDSNGKLCFKNNGYTSTVENDVLDDNWHHFAINVGRTVGRAQIYIDGELVNFFDSNELGGVAAANMFAGARGWYEPGNANTLKLDNFFEGTIDEIRIWKLYKYESQIQESNNVKLDGTEMGLLAYYPFEYYKEFQGQQELDFTLADMKIPSNPANAVPHAENTGGEQTSDIPPVKDKGPVSNLEFDFVVNNDALIITLNETLEKIEKTIVTFTVDGVQDMNGNENISPITWSAYIDRNQLRWSETKVVAAKPLEESYEFTVQAVNQSGAIQNFIISNMPSWMTVSPTSGTIGPSSSIDVTFKIDEGLNIGTYDEYVYLTNSDNVSETLDIQVKAQGEKPDWSVNPGDFDYSMAIYAKLRINNIFSRDADDLIAAFVDGQCIGVANVEYEERNDMWYAFLTVYNNSTTQSGIVYKIYDSSTGIVYLAEAGETINFENNKIIGTPADPKIFDAKELIYQNIDLSPGWNWISFNVASSALNSLNDLLMNMDWNSSDFFKSEADNISVSYSEKNRRWMGTSSLNLGNSLMYKLSSSANQTLSLSGSRIAPSSIPISIKGNSWNYISYLPLVRMKLDEALAGYDALEEDIVKSQDGFAMYSGNIGWVGSLTFMEPDKGYMLFRKSGSDVTLTYPDSEGTLVSKNAFIENQSEFVSAKYASNMTIVAETDVESQVNDRILAYSGNELSSESTINMRHSNGVYFITIPGNTNDPVAFALERGGQIIGHTSGQLFFAANDVKGSIEEPYLLQFENKEDEVIAYPNPVKNELTLSLITEDAGEIEIRIRDISGRLLLVQPGADVVGGQSVTTLNFSNFAAGLYFAYISLNGTDHVIKIEKQ
ncbi:LamG-like jellyroll fold domain-containing protein [Maribellus sediminis]|uniref:LamG-like jellyroll fold domain-containing protein n=1 Tax=Maribellus sediminis TaxID=2696285 RepID=UPI0014319358|nr:LamG-like jellyroll fold domain-containing protein [Maribellus sediminis]